MLKIKKKHNSKSDETFPMVKKEYRTQIKRALSQALEEEFSADISEQKDGSVVWWGIKQRSKTILISFGESKYTDLQEICFNFQVHDTNDKYVASSPSNSVTPYYPKWASVKATHSLDSKSRKLPEKSRYLYWLFSSRREWLMVYNDRQLNCLVSEIVPDMIQNFKNFYEKRI